jgi:GTP 3',8-cyclase
MLDRFNRRINYLRISVTDRCNQRCYYCMPKEGVNFINHEDILSYENIAEITAKLVELGVDKVRITGGEPLVRRGIISLVSTLSKIGGIKDLSMTTNGVLLSKYAEDLKKNGLTRLNVSLDSVNPVDYKKITNSDNLKEVLDGLQAAVKAGFDPIKLNCVIEKSPGEENAQEVAEFAAKNGFEVRFIRMMDIVKGEFWPVDGGDGGNCINCNRVRLSSDGRLFPCLFSDRSFSIKTLGVEEAYKQALEYKPETGKKAQNKFYILGG